MTPIDPQWAWLGAAALLAIAELIVPGVFLIFIAVAAALTGLVTLLTRAALPFQVALFALFSLALLYPGPGVDSVRPAPERRGHHHPPRARLGRKLRIVTG